MESGVSSSFCIMICAIRGFVTYNNEKVLQAVKAFIREHQYS